MMNKGKIVTNPVTPYAIKTPLGQAQANMRANRNSYRSKVFSDNVIILETYNNSGFVVIRENRERVAKLEASLPKSVNKLHIQIRALATNFQPSVQVIVPVIPNNNCEKPPKIVPEFHLFNGLIRVREIFDDYHSQCVSLYSKNDSNSQYFSRSCLVFYLNPMVVAQQNNVLNSPILPILELTAISGNNTMVLSKPIIIVPHLVPQFDPYSLAYIMPEMVQRVNLDKVVMSPMYRCIRQLSCTAGGYAINSITSSYTVSNFENELQTSAELCDLVLNIEPEERFDHVFIYRDTPIEYIFIALSPAGLALCVYKYSSASGPRLIDPVNDLVLTIPLIWSDSTKGDVQGIEIVFISQNSVILECVFRDPDDPINKRTRIQWTIDTSGVQVNMECSYIFLSHMIAMSVLHARQVAFQTFFRRASNEQERKLLEYVDHSTSGDISIINPIRSELIRDLGMKYPPSCNVAQIIRGAIQIAPCTTQKCEIRVSREKPAAIAPKANNEETICAYSLTHQIAANYLEKDLVPHIIRQGNLKLKLIYEGEIGIDAGGLTNDTINNLAHEAVSAFNNIMRPVTENTPLLQYHPVPEVTRDTGLYVLDKPTQARIHQCRMIGVMFGIYCMTNYRLHFNISNTLRFLMLHILRQRKFQSDPKAMYYGERLTTSYYDEIGVLKAEELEDYDGFDNNVSDVKEEVSGIPGNAMSTELDKEFKEKEKEVEEEEEEEEDVNIEYESYETSLSAGEVHPDPDCVIETPELRDARMNYYDTKGMLDAALGPYTIEQFDRKILPQNHGLDIAYINELKYYLKSAQEAVKRIVDKLPKNRKKKIRKVYKNSAGDIILKESANGNKCGHTNTSTKMKKSKNKNGFESTKLALQNKPDVDRTNPSDEEISRIRKDFKLTGQKLCMARSLEALSISDQQKCDIEHVMVFPTRYIFPYNAMSVPSVYYTSISNFSPADALAMYYIDAYDECHRKYTMMLHPNLLLNNLEMEAGFVMNSLKDEDLTTIIKEYKGELSKIGKQPLVKSLHNECIFRLRKQTIMKDGDTLYHVAGASSHVYFPLLRKYVGHLKKARFFPLPDPLDEEERPIIDSCDAPLLAASMAYHKLVGSVYYETAAICDGFRRVISAMKGVYEIVATLMTPFELAFNLRGTPQGPNEICNLKIVHMTDTKILEEVFEVEKIKKITALYNITMPDATVHCFWTVFGRMSVKERSMLYKFVTGSYLPPSNLTATTNPPALKLRFTSSPNMLPVAHTCFNTLEIPRITNVEEMHKRLSYCLGIEEFLIK